MQATRSLHIRPQLKDRLHALCQEWRGLGSSSQSKHPEVALSASGLEVVGPKGHASLTDDERALLTFFLDNAGVILTPETLLSRLWGAYRVHDLNFLAETVAGVNAALEEAGFAPNRVDYVDGVGYWMKPGR